MSEKPSFFAELRRRHVYRVAVAYAVVGWLLIQFATQVFPVFSLPNWASALIVLLVAIGFPLALILAWAFELTPDGIRRTEPAHSDDARPAAQTHRAKRRLDFIIIGVLGLLVIALLVDRFVLHKPPPTATAVGASDKSIAVLPFASLSEDKANAYFAEGIQDEILTRLAKIRALKVISRTSTQHYASSPDNLPVIAKQLNVANILEGSVQKAGDAVHITVQLIRAETDEHLWAESYNRKLDDIFGVEGEVAGAIAEQLNAQLSGTEQRALAEKPTRNAEAYDLYLRAVVFLARTILTAQNSLNASAVLEKAVQLDPAFASAWALLGRAHATYYWLTGGDASEKEASRRAVEAATRLSPNAQETLLAQGLYRYWVEGDKDSAKEIFARVHARWPNDSQSVNYLAAIARRQGRWNESLDLWEQAIALDPRDLQIIVSAANTARAMRNWPAARRFIDQGLDAAPGDKGVLIEKIKLFQAAGQIDEAQKILDRMEIGPGDHEAVGAFADNATLKRSHAAAIALVTAQLGGSEKLDSADLGGIHNALASLQRLTGHDGPARRSYEEARATIQSRLKIEPDDKYDLQGLAFAEAGLGNRVEALADIQRAITLFPASFDAYEGPTFEESLARLQARFGDKNAAITGLRHLLAIPYSDPLTPELIRLDPDFDNLRDDPRFQQLAQSTAASDVGDAPATAGKDAKHE